MTDASGLSPSAEFGLLLRTARDEAGMTQDQVADALHLDVAVVSAIEDGRFADLPMRPYARGYVRNYARVLGLDADELARLFDAADAGRPERRVVPRHRLTPKSELALRPLALGYAAIVAVLLIALGAVLWTAWRVQDWQFPFLADDSVEPATAAPATESPAGPPNVSPWPIVADNATEAGAADEGAAVASVEEPSAGEREGAPLAREQPSAGEREGVPLANEEPGASHGQVSEPQPQTAQDTDVPSLDEAAQEPALASEAIADAEPAPAGIPVAVSGVVGELTVVFDDESWVTVDDATGRQLFGDLGRNGRRITVAGPVPLSVLVGNAPGVRVEFDGESVDLEPFTSDTNVARFELGG